MVIRLVALLLLLSCRLWAQSGISGPAGPTGATGATGSAGPGLTIDVSSYLGADASQKFNNALAAASAGDILDLAKFITPQTFGTQVVINKAVGVINCQTTFTETMADPGVGASGGGINIAANGVYWTGGGQQICIITQGNAKNIQALVQSGSSSFVTFSNLTFNGNEANQTIPDSINYYGCWRASTGAGGGHDLHLQNVELTACGNRATDWRGTYNNFQYNNYLHQTGVNIAGGGVTTHGDGLHVDVDGVVHPYNSYMVDNLIEEWGDSGLACINGANCVVQGNTLLGQAYFGHTVNSFQGGMDVGGCANCTVVGNIVREAPTFPVSLSCNSDGVTYTLADNSTFSGNTIYNSAASIIATTPQIYFGARFGCQATNYTITGNSLNDVTFKVDGINGATITGNNFHFTSTFANTVLFDLSEDVGSVMENFTITGNTAVTDGAQPSTGVNIGATVTAPAQCNISPNRFPSTMTDITWQGGSSNSCFLPQAETLYAPFQNAGTTYPANPVGFYMGSDTLAGGRYNVIIGHGTGQSYNVMTRASSTNTDLLRIFDNIPAQWYIDVGLFKYVNDTSGPVQAFYKANGTLAAPTVVADFNTVGELDYKGYDGSAFTRLAWSRCYPIGTISVGVIPGQCSFNAHDASGVTTLNSTYDYGNWTHFLPVFQTLTGLTTGVAGQFTLQNTTASTVGVPVQNSPFFEVRGSALETGGNTSKDQWAKLGIIGTSAATATSRLAFYTTQNGNTGYTEKFSIYSGGNLGFGTAILVPPPSGTPTITMPTSTGTPAVTASTPIVLNSTTGNLTCPTCVRTLSAQFSTTDLVNCPNNTNTNFATKYTVAANTINANTVIRVFMGFSMTTSGSPPSFALMIFLGATQAFFASSLSPTVGITGRAGGAEFYIQGEAAASATSAVAVHPVNSWGSTSGALSPTGGNQTTQPITVATNGNLDIQPSLFCSANTAANSMTLNQLVVELVNP